MFKRSNLNTLRDIVEGDGKDPAVFNDSMTSVALFGGNAKETAYATAVETLAESLKRLLRANVCNNAFNV